MSILFDLQTGPVGQLMTQHSVFVGAAVQFAHIMGIISLLTAVLLVAFRLLGLGLKDQSVEAVAKLARPFLWAGLIAAVSSGFVMFASNATVYANNAALQVKLALLVTAFLLQTGWVRQLVKQPQQGLQARSGAILSLSLWFSVGLAGRAIGFV